MAWDAAFEAAPAASEDISQGASRITTLKTDIRDRAQVESNFGNIDTGYSDDGRANPGSARTFNGTTAPTQLLSPNGTDPAIGPSGFSATLGTNDTGRLWLDTSGDANVPILKWWDGNSWNPVQPAVSTENILSINGSMEVWQRGTAATAYVSTGTYLADRWVVYDVSATDTALMSRADTLAVSGATSQYSLKLKGDTGVGAVSVAQRIEAAYAPQYTGNISVSGHVFVDDDDDGTQSGNTTVTIRLRTPNNATDNDFSGGTTERANTAASGTLTNSRFTFGNINTSAYTNIAHGLEVQIQIASGALDSTAKAVYITDLQIEATDQATGFLYRSRAIELPKCKRYYEKTYDHDTAPATATTPEGSLVLTWHDGSTAQDVNWRFQQEKIRNDYTVTIYNPNDGTVAEARNYNAGSDVTGVVVESAMDTAGTNGVTIAIPSATAGHEIALHAVADAEL
jgi:hypothetical protein